MSLPKALEALYNTMSDKATEYVAAYNSHKKKKSELSALKSAAFEAAKEYNKAFAKHTYRQWNAEGNPVKTAIRTPDIKGGKRLQFKSNDDEVMTVHIKDLELGASLPEMQATLGADVFHDPAWHTMASTLAKFVADNISMQFGGSAIFNYPVTQAAKVFRFEGIDLTSEEGIILALQQVFDAILFLDDGNGNNIIKANIEVDANEKKYSSAWTYIREAMTTRAGRGIIDVCHTDKFSEYVLDAMHIILTNGDFILTTADECSVLADKPIVTNADETVRKTEDEALAE